MFKDKKMREVVETHLRQVNILLEHAKKEKLTEAINNYTSQKLALEYILRDFDKIWVLTMDSFFYIFSVANGEPPIGIPWETFQKYSRWLHTILWNKERSDIRDE